MSMMRGPRWELRNTTAFPSVGIVASKSLRSRGLRQGDTLQKLLRDHISTFKNWFIFATWGTYLDAILDPQAQAELDAAHTGAPLEAYHASGSRWHSRWPDLKYGYALRPGNHGGILQMVEHLESRAGRDRIEVLIVLTAPEDLEASYPDDRALLRGAIRNNALYLQTQRAASYWAAFEAPGSAGAAQQHTAPTRPEAETLALIAHDAQKLELCRWAVEHRHCLRRFHSIITIGATGSWVARFLKAANVPERQIDLIERAASGEADIQALLRTCAMPDVEVNLRLTERGATSWIRVVAPENPG
jgi:methylglyoxal synthase